MALPTANSFYLGGIELFSRRDSMSRSFAGGLTNALDLTADGSSVGQRGRARLRSITGTFVPPSDLLAPYVRNLLRAPGILPLVLPSGERYAVKIAPEGAALKGFYENNTQEWGASLLNLPHILLADLPWGGTYPGHYAYSLLATAPYAFSQAPYLPTMVPYSGISITNNGSFYSAYVQERDAAGEDRSQVTLEADITVSGITDLFVGLVQLSAGQNISNALGNRPGIGLHFATDGVRMIGNAGMSAPYRSQTRSTAGAWKVIVSARPQFGRIELWSGKSRAFWDFAVPWTLNPNMGALISCRLGTVILRQWWLKKG